MTAVAALAGLLLMLTASSSSAADSTCTDGGGHVWSGTSVWGSEYVGADGVRKVRNDQTGFRSSAGDADTVDYTVKTYDGAGKLLQTLTGVDEAYNAGAWRYRNPVNPPTAPGKAKVVVNVGDGNDGYGNCTMTFVQPGGTTPLTGTPTPDAPVAVGALAFRDEFDGNALSDKWAPSWFGGGTMNNVATSPANVSVRGGAVHLKLGSSTVGALISTNPDDGGQPGPGFEMGYGYTEARLYFPGDRTTVYNFPAWWTNGGRLGYTDGEHDIAEGLYEMTSNYHCCSPHVADNRDISGTWTNAFHTYGMHRQPGKADIYFDGRLVRSYATSDGGAPHYLVFNVGKRTSSPTDNNVTGDAGALRVDYVRVWKPL